MQAYYRLTKPGIIYGNLLTGAAGFFFASTSGIYFKLLIEFLIGLALVIAAACVFNNYLDQGIDAKMARTKNRALPTGQISSAAALVFASVLSFAGFTILSLFTNWYVVSLVVGALYFYVVIYGLAKRRTVHSTLIGSLPGAVPPAAGYLAVANHVDGSAVLLFLTIAFWQMPHFYAIAMYRFKDYKSAGLPVLTVSKGMAAAKKQAIAYILAFGVSASLLSALGYAGYTYLAAIIILTLCWLYNGLGKNWKLPDENWGKRIFFVSLIVNLAWCCLTAVGGRLP